MRQISVTIYIKQASNSCKRESISLLRFPSRGCNGAPLDPFQNISADNCGAPFQNISADNLQIPCHQYTHNRKNHLFKLHIFLATEQQQFNGKKHP